MLILMAVVLLHPPWNSLERSFKAELAVRLDKEPESTVNGKTYHDDRKRQT